MIKTDKSTGSMTNPHPETLLDDIKTFIEHGRRQAFSAVYSALRRMMQLAEVFPDVEIVVPLAR